MQRAGPLATMSCNCSSRRLLLRRHSASSKPPSVRIREGAGRLVPAMESIQIKRSLRLVSKASRPWLNVHVIGGVRRPGCLLLLTRTAELRGRHDVSRVAFISNIAHVDHRAPAVAQTLRELLSPETGMMPRAQEGTRQTLKNNFGRNVHSLHPRMRQLRGNAPRTGAYKRNVVLPHLLLIHEALFSAHAHRSIPCLVRLCHEVRTHVVSCNVHSARTAPLLSSSTRCVLRVVCEMIYFSSIEKLNVTT